MGEDQRRLFEEAIAKRMSRRQVLRRGAVAGLSLSSISAVLAACGEEGAGTTAGAAKAADPASVSPEWAKLVKAAQAEGELQLATIVGDGYANVGRRFGELYGLEVKLDQARSSDLATKLLNERAAGQHLTDCWFQTWSTMYQRLLPAGALDPVRPVLIHPEVTDDRTWRGGHGVRYMDPENEEYLPVIGTLPALMFTTNKSRVEQQPDTLDGLLEGAFAEPGAVAMAIPGQSGDGYLQWLYVSGHEDFLRELAARNPVQLVELSKAFRDLARGDYAVLLGGTEPRIAPIIEQGLPVDPVSFLPKVKPTGGLATFNASTPALINKAPHPNAAKLFVNWVMTQEGAQLASEGGSFECLRTDVPSDHLLPYQKTRPEAFENGEYTLQDAKLIDQLEDIRDVLINDIFRRA